jgi:hypothetical protein
MIDLIEFEYNSYESMERGHQSKQPTMDGVILPLNRQYREPKVMSRDDLRVSTVTTTFLLSERSAPISVCVYTYSSSNLEAAHLRRHSTANYTYGYTTRVKHAYGDGQYFKSNPRRRISLQKKHSDCHEHLHERNALTEKPTQFRRPTTMTSESTTITDN